MNTILLIMAFLIFISYFLIAYSLDNKKFLKGIIGLGLLTLISGTLLMICIILCDENKTLNDKIKAKCPEYEEVHGLYKLKNK